MLNARQNELLIKAVDLLNEADCLIQKALGADDEVYYIHTQLENAADDIVDIIAELDEDVEA